ncbi:alpha/beta fold hydrolase [Deinococcus radiotolerans]|uniref:Alpha/beta hydrolase n=1 Tax=Deinococcus radiotolerans TaxID=1309407 RepID=A0ABQ2FCW3_9DEIO|nr:alpha/beta hydrolase [Deinococcus radiotolerans]GGK86085.1 alpha/beta hydrolase [Deinococcus radiotolerans]
MIVSAADDTPLFVQERGEGYPLILLHGLGSHSGWLDADLDHFARTRRVIALDSRGHGRSGHPASFTLADHVSDVLTVMDSLGIAQADVMGTSMGSYVAQALAAGHPQRVSRLILIVPKASGQTSGTAALMAQHEGELRDLNPQQAQAFLLNLMFAPDTPQAIRDEVARRTAADHAAGLAQTPEQAEAARRALEHFDVRPGLPHVTAPTLILSGAHDPLNPPPAGADIAALVQHARQEVMAHSGHFPALEETQRYRALVDAFLADGQSAVKGASS